MIWPIRTRRNADGTEIGIDCTTDSLEPGQLTTQLLHLLELRRGNHGARQKLLAA